MDQTDGRRNTNTFLNSAELFKKDLAWAHGTHIQLLLLKFPVLYIV